MGRKRRNPQTTALRLAVIDEWNSGKTGPELSEMFGVAVSNVNHLLLSGRAMGYTVRAYSQQEKRQRGTAARVKNRLAAGRSSE